jgi:hypothetical protein
MQATDVCRQGSIRARDSDERHDEARDSDERRDEARDSDERRDEARDSDERRDEAARRRACDGWAAGGQAMRRLHR